MTCREFVGFLAQYVEGDLSEAERTKFDAHLAECPDCVTYVETYRETIRLGKLTACDDDLPEEVPEKLARAVLDARRRFT